MRFILKIALLFGLGIIIYTLLANWRVGNPWTQEALQNQLGVTLGLVEYQSHVVAQKASEESGKVLGEMTRRMGYQPIWQAISGTIKDEATAVPYNICKPVVTNYENR
jgi:hypothetical protein